MPGIGRHYRSLARFLVNLKRKSQFFAWGFHLAKKRPFLYTGGMSELALYRKYRPGKFGEVIGQEPIIKALLGSLKLGRIAHAYLLAGPRGTGKTTIARLLARELEASANDVYDIDGASIRGIDEIRELREAVLTLPFDSPRKVYIIDEVHMLTREAFNALLKTLEEPPPHVVFIFATTEINKVPETIVSRCQTFAFKKPGTVDLLAAIKRAARGEGWEVEPAAAEAIALASDGSFRDALGLLQQVAGASKDKKITVGEVEDLAGLPKMALVREFILATLDGDLARALKAVNDNLAAGRETLMFLKLTLRQLREALLLRLAPELRDQIAKNLSSDDEKFLETIGKHANANELPKILKALLEVYDDVRLAYLPALPLELALTRLISQDK